MIKLSIALLIIILIPHAAFSQTLVWGAKFGGTGTDNCSTHILDSQGNMYVAGIFSGTADFNPGSGIYNLTAVGVNDMYIAKISSGGALIWVQQYGENGEVHAFDMQLDASGNIFVAGGFRDTIDLDPGPGVTNLMAYPSTSSNFDAYVCKLDSLGNLIWAKGFGGFSSDYVKTIKLDAFDNLLLYGQFAATVDFDPGPATFNVSIFGNGIFISKFDTMGNFLWVKQMSQQGSLTVSAMEIDSAGHMYCVGDFQGPIDFDPGPSSFVLSSSGPSSHRDIFICKLTSLGEFAWAKKIGSDSTEFVTAVGFDAYRNIYLSGYFAGAVDFDPDTSSSYILTPGGPWNNSFFFCKLDSSGNFKWANEFALPNTKSITCDINNNIYLAGIAQSGLDADPGPAVHPIFTNGPCIIKFDQNCNFLFAISTTGNTARPDKVTIYQNTDIYVSGTFSGSIDFDPGPATQLVNSTGLYDGYIWKISAVTSLNENSDIRTFIIFPNPGSQEVELKIYLQSNEIIETNIFNIIGETVFSQTNFFNLYYNKLDVSNLPVGIYTIQLRTLSSTLAAKLVITR